MTVSFTPQAYVRLRKLLSQRCVECDRPCLLCNKFCSYCGAENPNFGEAELQHEFGQTLFEARAEVCKVGHPDAAANNWPTEYPDMPYCSLCGEKLY